MKSNHFPFAGEQAKILFESNPFPMWVYELESLRFLAVNDAAVHKYGYSKQEFSQMTLRDIRPVEDYEKLSENVHSAHASYQVSSGWHHVKKNGDRIIVEILSHEIDFNGKLARLVTINDITEKQKADDALKAAEHRYRSTLDNMQEGFQILSSDWKYLYVNKSAAEQGHSTREELLGSSIIEKYPGIENTEMFSHLRRCMQNSTSYTMENEFVYNDGSSEWFRLNFEPVPEGLLILSSNITSEKKAANEIMHLNRVYAVLSNINQAIVRIKERKVLLDAACRISIDDGKFKLAWLGMKNDHGIFIKAAAAVKDNVSPEVIESYSTSPFFSREAEAAILDKHHFIYNDLTSLTNDPDPQLDMILKNNCKACIILPIVVFNNVEGILTLFSGETGFFEQREIALLSEMVEDISFSLETMETEKRRAAAELNLKESEQRFYKEILLAKEKAEEMNRLKSNFLANMSHELRTPMIGILGTVDLIKDAHVLGEVKEFIPTFEDSCQRLLRTLNHLLDISKIESKQIKANFILVDVNKVLEQTISLYRKTAVEKGLTLNLNIESSWNNAVLDGDLLSQLLNNLVHNAIKFSHHGGVDISIAKRMIGNEEYLEIHVRDTGIGIPKEKTDLIFEPFRQASEGLSREHEGTGLGLTLVQKYTKLMGGKISLTSEVGRGSDFCLHFPAAKRESTGQQAEGGRIAREVKKETITSAVHILYVDDDKTSHFFVNKFLEGICHVDNCEGASQGLELLRRKNYELILLDINLGAGMSGVDLVPVIKKVENMDNVPLVAVTGYAMAGDKEKFLQAGFDYYIAKPFIKDQLRSKISKIINSRYMLK